MKNNKGPFLGHCQSNKMRRREEECHFTNCQKRTSWLLCILGLLRKGPQRENGPKQATRSILLELYNEKEFLFIALLSVVRPSGTSIHFPSFLPAWTAPPELLNWLSGSLRLVSAAFCSSGCCCQRFWEDKQKGLAGALVPISNKTATKLAGQEPIKEKRRMDVKGGGHQHELLCKGQA